MVSRRVSGTRYRLAVSHRASPGRGGSWGLPPGSLSKLQATLGNDYIRQKPKAQMKCRQHWALLVQEAPVPPQQTVVPPVPGPSAQIRFVLSVQHCSLVEQTSPNDRGRQRGHRRPRLRFRLLLLFLLRLWASVSLERAVSPTTATVDAAAAPSADLRVLRLLLA